MERSKSTINVGHEEYVLQKAKNEELPFRCTHSHHEVKFKNFTLSCIKNANSYCYMKNKHVVIIKNISQKMERQLHLEKR